MLRKIWLSLLLVSMMTVSFAVFGASESLRVQLQAGQRANLNDANQASPLPISIFLLTDAQRFTNADYFSLEENSRGALGGDYINKRSMSLLPGKNYDITLSDISEARYLAVIAGYHTLKGKQWRRVINLAELSRDNIVLAFNGQGVAVQYVKKSQQASQGFYAEGSIGYGLLTTAIDMFYKSSTNPAELDVTKQDYYGQLGIAFGYQWQRGVDNWLNTLHLEKFSLGVGYYYTPLLNFSGQRLDHLNDLPLQKSLPFSAKTSQAEYMLESKVNFLRLGKFTTFLNGGLGISVYSVQYQQSPSDDSGVVFETDSTSKDMLYKAGIGEEFDVDKNLSLSLAYEYNTPTKINLQEYNSLTSPTITINNNMILFKVRYQF